MRWIVVEGLLRVALAAAVAIALIVVFRSPRAACVWIGLVLLWPGLRDGRGVPAGHCESCGYDLRGIKGRCPECGRAIDPQMR